MTDRTVSLVDSTWGTEVTLAELGEHWARYGHDLLVHDPGGPGECLVRRGELVAARGSLDPALSRLRRWVDRVEHDDDLQLARVRLRTAERDRCIDIAGEVPELSANHVHVGSATMFGTPVMFGTGADPGPAEPVEEPARQRWGVTVAVLDTGCDPHPWFAARDWFEAVPEVLDADDDSDQDRQAGHGTFVSGVLLRHAPGVTIRPRRVLSSLGFTDDLTVVAGLRALRRESAARVDVVLLTAGCHTSGDRCPPTVRAELARFGDAVVVAAAGNHGSSRPFWPAALPEVLGVAASGADGALAGFSNSGDWVDACAPGVDVVSSHVRMSPGTDGARRYGFARWSGTSFAAPQVAAGVATAVRDGHGVRDAARVAARRYPFGG
ncbi:S8/S53 family peptidase [Saccharopolyspora gloriosae]|uniref:S8 family peptidase n=1 Tax=Saccharopolyspora gloriosae TaxID=455344 RepID=UPI001FB5F9D6|nr:S8/S53 family peptidase [Saccharopolyspora gloriosae]